MSTLKNQFEPASPLASERGGAKLATIVMISATAVFLIHGREFLSTYFKGTLEQEAISQLYFGGLVLLGIISFFCLGCAVHLILIGANSARQIKKQLRARIEEVRRLIAFNKDQFSKIEDALGGRMARMTPRGSQSLTRAKKIVAALEQRLEEVGQMMKGNGKVGLFQAHQQMSDKLYINDNCLNSVISIDPIEPLSPFEWPTTLERLVERVHLEMRQKAA